MRLNSILFLSSLLGRKTSVNFLTTLFLKVIVLNDYGQFVIFENMTSFTITYRIAVRGEPSYGHG